MKIKLYLGLVISLFVLQVQATVVLPHIFSDNMVLQRNVLIPVWGRAAAGEKIEISFNKQVKKIQADKNGKWMLKLDAEKAGGPYVLTIKGSNTILLKNILVGEVWICSGQSNMEWSVAQSKNASKEISAANNPFIRHIKVSRAVSSLPENDFSGGSWTRCDSTTVSSFSAVGYYFAKNMYKELNIPIGIINTTWGGTNIETWISRQGFESSDEFKEMIATVPEINLDSLSKLLSQSTELRIMALQESKLNIPEVTTFKELSYDDSKWPELLAPQLWEQQAVGDLDGVVWLRKTIVLSQEEITGNAVLHLAKIDDDDISYVNAVKVGSTNQYDAQRKYAVPAGILKPGKNVIAVRVTDNTGGGGIYGNSEDLKLVLGEKIISLAGKWKFQVESIKKTTNENSLPSLCYNAMINPLIPYAFKGVLWYQGEANESRAYQYRKAFPLLINDWRQQWKQGDFPFYFVQLSTYNALGNSNEGCAWAELREAQTLTTKVSNTAMVVTTDLGDSSNIHPINKQDVGKRLAALALNNLYKIKMVCKGPSYSSMKIKGNEIIVSFKETGTGLMTTDANGFINGFEIAGADRIFYTAKAIIKNNTVIVYSDKVTNPVSVHYAWLALAGDCNLFNKEGFPAVPFRTDEWKTVTLDAKYKVEKIK